ncbi:hypothetical protein ADIS_2540 [Lunatimonas lonarensis]|uniref:Uncharacterized protein n=1 Tax=Lunatimonas lonarensis TaxID=1232681 RepID=R7ZSD4_9BACT|nr:hypothetical protein ADIS_2540 [Lunatimonas lonarensis]
MRKIPCFVRKIIFSHSSALDPSVSRLKIPEWLAFMQIVFFLAQK